MARALIAALEAEIQKAALQPIFFVQLEVATSTVRVWSGVGTLTWNGQTWTGIGQLGMISPVTETTETRAEGIILTLSGVDPTLLGYALTEIRHGKDAKVWLGAMDDAGAVLADPYLSFAGKVDTASIDEGGEAAQIQITVESRLIEMHRPRDRRWTYEDQQMDYPGDLGFEYVAGLQELNLVWGRGTPIPLDNSTDQRPPGWPPGIPFPIPPGYLP